MMIAMARNVVMWSLVAIPLGERVRRTKVDSELRASDKERDTAACESPYSALFLHHDNDALHAS
jgi:hypothetical protein